MTEDLKRLQAKMRELAEKIGLPFAATTRQGSWDWVVFHRDRPNFEVCQVFHDGTEDNELGEAYAEYIVAAANSVPALLDTIAALQAENELLRQAHAILRDVNNQLVEHNTIDSNKFFFDMVSYLYNLHQSQGQPDPIETKYPPFESLSMDSAKCPECGHENCPCERISVNAPPEPAQGEWDDNMERIHTAILDFFGSK